MRTFSEVLLFRSGTSVTSGQFKLLSATVDEVGSVQ